MYKEIKNHYDDNTTFVFQFKGDVYALNGCTLYNHSRAKSKEWVYEMHDVDLCYGIDIDMIVGDITEDITRTDLFYIMSDVEYNIFNQYYDGYTDDTGGETDNMYGIVDIKEWYLSDIHTVIKHIKQGNTHFTRSIFNHKGLIDLTVDELKADVINNIIYNGFSMDDFGALDNIFKIMSDKGFNDETGLRNYKDYIVELIFICKRKFSNRLFRRGSDVKGLVKYIRDNRGVEGDDNIVPTFICSNIIKNIGCGGNQKSICDVLDSGHFQKYLNEKEFEILFEILFEIIIQQTIYNGDVFGFIRDVQKFPTLRKEITKNKGLLEIFKCLVRVYDLQVKIIQDDHKNMLTLLED